MTIAMALRIHKCEDEEEEGKDSGVVGKIHGPRGHSRRELSLMNLEFAALLGCVISARIPTGRPERARHVSDRSSFLDANKYLDM